MLRSFKYLRWQEWLLVLLTAALIVEKVRLDLLLPEYMATITELTQTQGHALQEVLQAGGKMLLCALGSLTLATGAGFTSAITAARYSATIRAKLYRKVLDFSPAEINQFSTPSLITRSTNDITQMQMFMVVALQILMQAPLMAVMAMQRITNKSWAWSGLTAAVVGYVVILMIAIMIYAMPRFTRIQGLIDNLARVVRENLTGLLVVRAYNAESYEESKLEQANRELATTQVQAGTAMSLMNPGINFAMNGLTLGIYWVGAILISNITIHQVAGRPNLADIHERVTVFADMIVFMSYAMQVIMSFLMLIFIFVMMPRAVVAARRVCEVLDTPLSIVDGGLEADALAKREDGIRGKVEFKNVSFTYPGAAAAVVENVSFVANPGQTVALIGATGSGKSSIVNLIPRLYDATQGEVLVDGVNVREYKEAALRDKIGFVPQKTFLFSGTIRSNLGYGRIAQKDLSQELYNAACVAQASEFIENLEAPEGSDDKFEHAVAQGGANFSGGQRQRLTIARAVAKQPEIFVFDDSFSALDYATDRTLRSALKQQAKHATKIIVAQRIGTIIDADEILVIDEGKIVGRGKHKELLESCDVYREIALSQLSEKELER